MEGCRRKPRRYDVRRQVWEVGDISTVEEIIERREKLAPRDSGIGEALRDKRGVRRRDRNQKRIFTAQWTSCKR